MNIVAPVVRRSDDVIHRINLYPEDNARRFAIIYLLDSDLSVGQRYAPFKQPGPDSYILFLQALAHVQSWRGKKQITAGKLLVELWKKEEANMGVARDKIGKVTGNYLFTLLIYL